MIKKVLLLLKATLCLSLSVYAQGEIPLISPVTNVCPYDYVEVASSDPLLQNFTGNVCVDGGEITMKIGGSGNLYLTSDTKFAGGIEGLTGVRIYNYSQSFILAGDASMADVVLYNYGGVIEDGVVGIDGAFTIFNDEVGVIDFTELVNMGSLRLTNYGNVVFKQKPKFETQTFLNNEGYLTFGLGVEIGNETLNNSGVIAVPSGLFDIQGFGFKNNCVLSVNGNVNSQLNYFNDGVIIYSGTWDNNGFNIRNSSPDAKVSGGLITGEGGALQGMGEYWFEPLNPLIDIRYGDGPAHTFFINQAHPSGNVEGNGTNTTIDPLLPKASITDRPMYCSAYVGGFGDEGYIADDEYTFSEDQGMVSFNVTDNDEIFSEGGLIVRFGFFPMSEHVESLNILPDGKVSLQMEENFFGEIAFTYSVSDGMEGEEYLLGEATVRVLFEPINDRPDLETDLLSGLEDQPFSIFPLLNDDDSLDIAYVQSPGNGLDPTTFKVLTQPENGILDESKILGGELIYIPNTNFFGLDSLQYEVCDKGIDLTQSSLCASEWVYIDVLGDMNDDFPFAIDDEVMGLKEDLFPFTSSQSVLLNDFDEDVLLGDIITVKTTTALSLKGGSLNMNADGSYEYIAPQNFHGIDSVLYTIEDLAGNVASAYLIFQIDAVNDPIRGVDDFVTVNEDDVVSAFEVLDNDINGYDINDRTYFNGSENVDFPLDVQGGLQGLTIISQPKHGFAQVVNNAVIDYTPNQGYTGSDSLIYKVCDKGYPGISTCDSAQFLITVLSVNAAPIANEDIFFINEDNLPLGSDFIINQADGILLNDTDADNDPLEITAQFGNAIGDFIIEADGSFSYTPFLNYFGSDSVNYVVSDGNKSDTATLFVFIAAVGDKVEALDDTVSMNEGEIIDIEVLINDHDDADIKYGSETLPVGQLGGVDVSSLVIVDLPLNGEILDVDLQTGKVIYESNPFFYGEDHFTYKICDLGYPEISCDTGEVIVQVEGINTPSVALPDSITFCEDEIVLIDVKQNDNDFIDGNNVLDNNIEILTPTTKLGGANVVEDQIEFIPNKDAFGVDTVSYRICDQGIPSLCSEPTWVKIELTPVNDTLVVSEINEVVAENSSITIDVKPGVNDVRDYLEGTSVEEQINYATFKVLTTPNELTEGTVSNIGNGMFEFTAAPGVNNKTVLIQYEVCDKGVGPNACNGSFEVLCQENVVQIDITADAPKLVADSITGDVGDTLWEGSTIVVNPLINDFDPNDNGTDNLGNINISTLEVKGADGVFGKNVSLTNGTVAVNSVNGELTIIPDADYFTAPNSFVEIEYRVKDSTGYTGVSKIIYRVWAVNDVLNVNADFVSTDEEKSILIDVLANDNDNTDGPNGGIDVNTLAIDNSNSPFLFLGDTKHGRIEVVNGEIEYTPNVDFYGVDSFYYAVADVGYGEAAFAAPLWDTALVVVNIINKPEDLLLPKKEIVLFEDVDTTINMKEFIEANLIEGLAPFNYATLTLTNLPKRGDANNNLEFINYRPSSNNFLDDSLKYKVFDTENNSYTGLVYFDMQPLNDTLKVNYIKGNTIVQMNAVENENVSLNWGNAFSDKSDTDFGVGGIDFDSFDVIEDWKHGNSTSNINGELIYKSDKNFEGQDDFVFRVCDMNNAGYNSELGNESVTCHLTKIEVIVVSNDLKKPELEVYNNEVEVGTDPFKLITKSKSKGEIYYQLEGNECIAVDDEGTVSHTCAGSAMIKIYQEETDKYRADSAFAEVIVRKQSTVLAITTKKGALGGFPFMLDIDTNFDGVLSFEIQDTTIATVSEDGLITPISVGTTELIVYASGSDTYIDSYKSVIIEILPELLNPIANNDSATTSLNNTVMINLIENDEGTTGTVLASSVDLDTLAEGVQSYTFDKRVGYFEVDTAGVLTFTPFEGFVGKYILYYTVKDNNLKVSEVAEVYLEVTNPEAKLELKANEVMTPNGDGVNDVLLIGYTNPERRSELIVYDINGMELFRQENYLNDWSGVNKDGEDLPVGNYFYVYREYNSDDQTERELKSYFNIIR